MTSNTPVKTDVSTPTKSRLGLWDEPFAFPLFHRLGGELDSMFRRFGMEPPMERMPGAWTPQMEVYTKDNEFGVKLDVPGMKKDDITVEVANDRLVLRGERKEEKEEKKEGYYKTERTYGSFYRAVPLPDGVNADSAKASMHDGVLTVTMPMTAVVEKARKLEIGEPTPVKTTKAA